MSFSLRHDSHLAVYLILRKGSSLLLGERQNTGYMDGYYGLPSGHLEAGESGIMAVCREAQEEAGIDLVSPNLIHTNHTLTDKAYLNLFFECTQWEGDIENREPTKCKGWEFFSEPALPQNVVPFLRQTFKLIKQGVRYAEMGWESKSLNQQGLKNALIEN